MSNPLYGMIGGQQQSNIIQRFQQFRRLFKGDPKQQVQQLLNSGRITQDQYNKAVQTANQLAQILGIK